MLVYKLTGHWCGVPSSYRDVQVALGLPRTFSEYLATTPQQNQLSGLLDNVCWIYGTFSVSTATTPVSVETEQTCLIT